MTTSNHKGKTLIRWNSNEWNRIAEEVVKLQQVPSSKKRLLVDLVRVAQEVVLDRARQKSSLTSQSIEKTEMWKSAYFRAKQLAEANHPPKPTPAPVVQSTDVPHKPVVVDTEPLPEREWIPEKPVVKPQALVGKSILEIFADHMANALKKTLTDPDVVNALKNVVLDAITTPAIFSPLPEEQNRRELDVPYVGPEKREVRKPRVSVFGLLPIQAESLRKEFGQDLELRFFTAETNHRQMTQNASWAEHTLVMTGFIGHAEEDAVRRGNCPDFRRIAGGPSDCARTLRSIVGANRAKIK